MVRLGVERQSGLNWQTAIKQNYFPGGLSLYTGERPNFQFSIPKKYSANQKMLRKMTEIESKLIESLTLFSQFILVTNIY